MKTESMQTALPRWLLFLVAAGSMSSGPLLAQVPVDESGNPIEAIDEPTAQNTDVDPAQAPDPELENLTAAELETLVGRIALYPDDLLAVVLPASAYPLQIVQAARFLEQLESDSSLLPDESWDPSVTALLNYPEVVKLMNEDIDWTYKLGEAVVRQQADVIAAIETFRDRAYAAGNLKSDERQTVTNEDGVIEIQPVEEKIIYVPYYEPERVVVYQTQPVYYYYPRPCPVYYYPYPYGYSFASGYFWGVTTAFTIGWTSHHLRVFHHSYRGHPYYGHHYFGHYYRRPSISVYNTYYVNNHVRRSPHHYRDGDFWRPRRHGGALPGHYRSRADYYSDTRRERSEDGYRDRRDSSDTRQIAAGSSRHAGRRPGFSGETGNEARERNGGNDTAARFAGNRSDADTSNRGRENPAERRRRADAGNASDNDTIRFRPRERADVARRATVDDDAIRFRARERSASRSTIQSPPAVTSQGDRNDRHTVTNRSRSNGTVASPASRERTVNRGFRSSSRTTRPEQAAVRRAGPARVTEPRAAPSVPHSARPSASAPRSMPRPSANRPSASRPSGSRPSASRPSASRPSASRPAATSRQAPSRESRAAPPRSSASDNGNARRRANQQ